MAGESIDLRLLRPEDLLVLDVRLVNLVLDADGRLYAGDPERPARVVIGFPPQHVAEAAFLESADPYVAVEPIPVRSAAAGPSRLAFDLVPGEEGIPFTLAGLLDWGRLLPALPANALPSGTLAGPDGVRPAEPGPDETALELVYRLVLSPVDEHAWAHRTEPLTGPDGLTELWHTRLVTPTNGPAALRAVSGRTTQPFLTSLSAQDVAEIVLLTGDFGNAPPAVPPSGISPATFVRLKHVLKGTVGWVVPPPATLRTDRLVLTALGAHLRTQGRFDFPRDDQDPESLRAVGVTVPSLARYEHVTGLGRDQAVTVVRRGYLDTGHRATLVKITERRFEPIYIAEETAADGQDHPVYGTRAVLRQFYRVVVTQPELDCTRLASGYPRGRREMPLRSLVLRTRETPLIELPGVALTHEVTQEQIDLALGRPFWIRSGGQLLPFDLDGVDGEGRSVTLRRAMMFVPYAAAGDTSAVLTEYNYAPEADRRASLRGQRLALTETHPDHPDASTAATESLTFDLVPVADRSGLPADYVPGWLPEAREARVQLEPLERLTGSGVSVRASLSPAYLDHGWDGDLNPAALFATFAPVDLLLGAAEGGGLCAPAMALDALSAAQGAVARAMAVGADVATLKSVLAGMKLFGTVEVADLLCEIEPLVPQTTAGSDADLDAALALHGPLLPVPVVRNHPVLGPDGVPVATVTRLAWKPALLEHPPDQPVFSLAQAELALDVRTVTRLDGTPPETRVWGELRGFALTLGKVVELRMATLTFRSEPGRKPDVDATGVALEFVGALRFVETVRRLLPEDAFSDPPAIAVTPQGITAGVSLGIPTVGIGVFSLQNLSLSAVLSLPFVGRPAGLRFALSSREHPFLITVSLFGGGGFFALGVSAAGLEEVEASLEFGGNVSLNLGVASGGVHVMAGVYFKLAADGGVELSGYLRCGGYLSVLGLITVSLEFYLAFAYREKPSGGNEIWGQASLTVSVKVLCFSTSVKLSIEKRFAGPAGDPTFDQVVSEDDWVEHCLAFAPEPAP